VTQRPVPPPQRLNHIQLRLHPRHVLITLDRDNHCPTTTVITSAVLSTGKL